MYCKDFEIEILFSGYIYHAMTFLMVYSTHATCAACRG